MTGWGVDPETAGFVPSGRVMPVLRRATAQDIDRLMALRNGVAENRLSDPGSVLRSDYEWFVGQGRVWVWEEGGLLSGFSAGDERDGTIWALFVDASQHGRGIGRALLAKACEDLRHDGFDRISLTTGAGTRAERLYRHLGWTENGVTDDGDLRFVLTQ
jgi:GNAT superfamily N-acetyltransferase